MSNTSPSVAQLKRALVIAEQIQKLEGELASLLGAPSSKSTHDATSLTAGKSDNKRSLSPAARARIVAAQKARWAKVKGTSGETPASTPKAAKKVKAKRNISPEARQKMADAARRRWELVKGIVPVTPA